MKLEGTTGETLWAKRYGGDSFDFGVALVRKESMLWVGANTQSDRLRNGGTDFLILRASISDGTRDKLQYFGANSKEEIKEMLTDSSQSYMYLAGTTDTISLTRGLTDFLIVKYSLTTTTVSWIGTLGTTEEDILESISIDESSTTTQGIYLVGSSSNFASSYGLKDIVILKLDISSLELVWQVFLGTSNDDVGYTSTFYPSLKSLIFGGSSGGNVYANGVDYLGRSQWKNLGVTKISNLFTLVSQDTTLYKFTDGVPTVDEAVSSSISTSVTSSSLTLSDSSVTVSHACSSYTPIAPISFPTKLTANLFQKLTYSIPFFCYSPSTSLTYTITQSDGSVLPSWLSFDQTNFQLTGTPINGATSSYYLVFKVEVTADPTNFIEVNLELYVNSLPVVNNPISDVSSRSGVIMFIDVPTNTWSDPDGDAYTVTVTQKPSWMLYLNDRLQGTPDETNIGEYIVIVVWEDVHGGDVSTSFKVTINKNHVPVVVTKIPDQAVPKNVLYSYTVNKSNFRDANSDDTLQISMDNTNYSWLSLNTSTWVLSGTPTTDNEYNITITVTDNYGASVSDTFLLVTGSGLPNTPPLVQKTIGDVNIFFEKVFSERLGSELFYDSDGDLMTYLVRYQNGGALESWMSFEQGQMILYGEVPSEDKLNGKTNLSLRITASDGKGGTAYQNFNVIVTDDNESGRSLLVIILSMLLSIILISAIITVLIFTYKYWTKKTKRAIYPEVAEKSKDKYLQNSSFDLNQNKEHLETHRDLKDTENLPSSENSENERDAEMLENLTKFVLTETNFHQK
jgi:hypothetical protein